MSIAAWIIGGLVVGFAAVVRGFSGFGFSALTVVGLSFLMPPASAVPPILMMEIAASIWMLPEVRRDIDWKWLAPIMLGFFVGTPCGIWLLVSLPEDVTRLFIYTVILLLGGVALIFRGRESDAEAGRAISPGRFAAMSFAVGIVGGIVNGLSAVGLVIAVFMLLMRQRSARIRASLVTVFFASDIFALLWGGGFGLVGAEQFLIFGVYLIPLILGVMLGAHFSRKGGELLSFAGLANCVDGCSLRYPPSSDSFLMSALLPELYEGDKAGCFFASPGIFSTPLWGCSNHSAGIFRLNF